MKIYTDTPEGVTVVKNAFIDQYMPQANGEFVKVYLYLLRCANTGRELSLSSIADMLNHTEKDVQRALSYWEKQDLIHLKSGANGTLQSITFSDLPSASDDAQEKENRSASAYHQSTVSGWTGGSGSAASAPEASAAPNRDRLTELSGQQEVRQLFFVAEQYLQRPLTSSEQSDFVYYYDTLKFSTDLIVYLLEYCISKGSFSRHYMRRVALSWAEAGITTVMQAKQESSLYNKNYFTILNSFGIKGRGPAQPEIEAMSRWLNEYGFPLDLIVEACNRTIRTIHQPSFEYADKILTQWKRNAVTTLSDVQKLDQQRSADQQKRAEQKKNAPQTPKQTNNRFNNFSQRDYDYSQLERQLLNN